MTRAVFDLRTPVDWNAPLRQSIWALLPLGTRPMVETWIEQACANGCREFLVVPKAEELATLSRTLGDGSRWGCRIDVREKLAEADQYRSGCGPADGRHLNKGILWMNEPCLLSEDLIRQPIDSLHDYFRVNLDLSAGVYSLPVAPGYEGLAASAEGESVGLEPILAPSARFHSPLMLGDHVRVNGFAELGPNAVIGNHVVVGRGSRVVNSLILDDTYIGAGLNVDGRIVDGRRLIDPRDGLAIELDDLLLADLQTNRSPVSDLFAGVRRWFAPGAKKSERKEASPAEMFSTRRAS